MPRDENDLQYEVEFFTTRSRIKNPKPQKKSPEIKLSTATPPTTDLVPNVKKRRPSKGNAYQHTKTGAREDLGGIVCRSSWEGNVLRVLQLYKIDFLFEPKVFTFPAPPSGRPSAYLPDVWLSKTDEYIEVKGMLDARGRNKLRKFKKHYPLEFSKMIVIISKSNKDNKFFFTKLGVNRILYYEHLTKLFADKIIHWEGKKK